MKKVTKCILKIAALGVAAGGAFAYLKNKGYITVSTGHEDEDYDDFSCPDSGCSERTYINVDTDALKAKAKEMAQEAKSKAGDFACACKEKTTEFAEKAQDVAEDLAEEIKDKAEDAYDEAKKMANTAKENIASSIEKAWYNTGEQTEKVEEFFNDEP